MDPTRQPDTLADPRRRLEALLKDLCSEIDAELRWLSQVQHLMVEAGPVTTAADRQTATIGVVEGLHAVRTINDAVRALTAEAIQTADQLAEPPVGWATRAGTGEKES